MGNPYAPHKKSTAKVPTTPESTDKKAPEASSEPQNKVETQEHVETDKSAKESTIEVPEATMEGILDWVGADKERAAAAIEHEKSQPKPRKTLLSKLGDI